MGWSVVGGGGVVIEQGGFSGVVEALRGGLLSFVLFDMIKALTMDYQGVGKKVRGSVMRCEF